MDLARDAMARTQRQQQQHQFLQRDDDDDELPREKRESRTRKDSSRETDGHLICVRAYVRTYDWSKCSPLIHLGSPNMLRDLLPVQYTYAATLFHF